MPDYSKGKIYEIVCRISGEKYIGSTTLQLCQRLAHHRCLKNNKCISKNIIEKGDYYINLLEECPCDNKEQLLKKEREWYDKGDNINKIKPSLTEEELINYYKTNHYHNDNYSKDYYQNNKTKLLENTKQYREANKKLIEEKITCECGVAVRKSNISVHRKREKHIKLISKNLL